MRKLLGVLLIIILFTGIGCSKKKQAMKEKEKINEVVAEVREDDFMEEEDYDIIRNNTDFAFELFMLLKDNQKNLLFSPFSVSSALAMTYAGARGITEDQMSKTLHFTRSQIQVHSGFMNLSEEMIKADETRDQQFTIANSLWAQENYGFLDDFYNICKKYYGSGFQYMDFANQPEKSLIKINDWVEQQTNHKIVNLLPSGSLTSETRLVLTNAIWFYGKWLIPFDEKHSEMGDFILRNGKSEKVKFMNHPREQFMYYKDSFMQILELPYENKKFSMLVFLPESHSRLMELEKQFTSEFYRTKSQKLRPASVEVLLPRFKFSNQLSLGTILAEMGMQSAFNDQADFSGMTGTNDLRIDQVFHKTYIEVNEKGTEAAGATAVVMVARSSLPSEKELFQADRPFLFVIKDNESGSIIFIGRVMNPLLN